MSKRRNTGAGGGCVLSGAAFVVVCERLGAAVGRLRAPVARVGIAREVGDLGYVTLTEWEKTAGVGVVDWRGAAGLARDEVEVYALRLGRRGRRSR